MFNEAIAKQQIVLFKEILSLISNISFLMKASFLKYYQFFMPGINQMLQMKSEDAVKSKLIETAGILMVSVANLPQFDQADMDSFIQFISSLESSSSDIITQKIKFLTLMCEHMKPELFGKYLL